MVKKLTRKQQAVQTRNRILDSSLELMRTYPFYKIKIKDICEKADVTTGAFYHYFSSKEDIIVQLYLRIDQEFTEYYSVLRGDTYRDKIREYLKRHAKFAEKCGIESTRNVYREQLNMKTDFFGDFTRGFAKYLLELVEQAIEAGEIQCKSSAKQMCIELMDIERGAIYTWCLTGGEMSVVEISGKLINYYLKSVSRIRREHYE